MMMEGFPETAGSTEVIDDAILNFVNFHDTIVVSTSKSGVYYVTNTDPVWKPLMVNSIFPKSVTSLIKDGQNLYAGTIGQGVWKMNVSNLPTTIHSVSDRQLLQVFPNPASTTVEIRYGKTLTSNVVVHIYNVKGEHVLSHKSTHGDRQVVDVHHLPPGQYFVTCRAGNKMYSAGFAKM